MAEESLTIRISETGAEITGTKIRQVTKSYEDLQKAAMKNFAAGNTMRSVGSGSLFDPARIRDIGSSADKTKGSVTGLARSFTFLGAAVAGIAVRKTVSEVIELTDTLTNLQNKIKVVTTGTEQLAYIQHELFDIARETRSGIDSIATVYTRTARSVKDLGKSQAETLQFTETLSKAVAVGGSTAVEASNAMIQLSKGLSSGTLRGDELRSVLEQLPIVAQLISKHLGVSIGQLRALGAAGKLTSEEVFDAIIAGTDEMAASFAKMTPTVAQSWETIKTAAIKASEALQPSMARLANTLLDLADNFGTVIKVGMSVANVLGVVLATKAIGTLITAIKALTVVTASNPWGALAVGIAAAVAAIAPFADKIGDTKDNIITLKDVWTAFSDKVVSEVHKMQDAFGGLFDFKDFEVSIESILRKLAKAADFVYLLAHPELSLRFAAGDKNVGKEIHANEIGMNAFLRNAKGAAADRIAQNFQDKFEDTNARFNAFMADRMPGAHPKGPAVPAKTKKESGKTFQELLDEQQKEHFLLQMTNHEREIQKELMGELAKLKDSEFRNASQKQVDELSFLVRRNKDLAQAQDYIEQITKELEKQRQARLQISVDLGERESKGISDAFAAREAQRKKRREEFGDPNAATKREIGELKDFRDDPRTVLSEAVRAQEAINRLTLSMEPLAVAFQGVADTMIQGFGDAIARAIVLNENLGSLLKNLAQVVAMQAISGLVSLGTSSLIGAMSSSGAASTVGNAARFDPVAGINRTPGFASGGYTGETGGVVHPREYVLNAQATQAMGISNLNAINTGRAGAGASATRIIINQNAPGVVVQAQEVSRGEIQVMIEKGVAQSAPRAVASAMNEPNSPVTKSIRRNFDVDRRTV